MRLGLRAGRDDLKDLARKNPKFFDIIGACAFDKSRDFNGAITPKVFFDHFFIKHTDFDENYNRLSSKIHSPLIDNSVLFLSGYGGTGKTTLINYYMKEKHTHKYMYIDFSSIVSSKDRSEIIDGIKHVVLYPYLYYKDNVIINEDNIQDYLNICFDLLKTYHSTFRLYIRINIIKMIKEYDDKDLPSLDDAHDIVDNMNDVEILTMFFMMLFLTKENNIKYVIFLDNLDDAKKHFLSRAFRDSFVNALEIAICMPANVKTFQYINFFQDYRFVFTLRDANNANIRAQIQDRLGLRCRIVDVNFSNKSSCIHQILEHRLRLASDISELQDPSDIQIASSQAAKLLENFIKEEHLFFEEAILGLFNNNIKKLYTAIVSLVENPVFNNYVEIYLSLKLGDENEVLHKFGARGGLLFWSLYYLRDHAFLNDFVEQYRMSTRASSCFMPRMILTVIANKTKIREYDSSNESRLVDTYTLTQFLTDMRFDDLYSLEAIIESLIKMFKWYDSSWAHLLTIYNYPVLEELGANPIIKSLKVLKKYGDDYDEISYSRELHKISDITLKINPAGIALVKDVLPHFEFYAVLEKATKPLFMTIYFEEKEIVVNLCNSIYEKVNKLVSQNTKFYNSNFKGENEAKSEDDYKRSAFTWRIIRRERRTMGMFHMPRVILNHLGYLNSYRRYMCLQFSKSELEKKDINKYMVRLFKKYLAIAERTPDSYIKDRYIPNIQNKVQQIVDSGYTDCKIDIMSES